MDVPDSGWISGGRSRIVAGDLPGEVATPSRITVVESVTHNVKANQPHVVTSKFGRNQQTDEQSFERRLNVSTEWTKLECGWITVCGMLLIRNEEGKFLQKILSTEERIALNAKVVEVFFGPASPLGEEDACILVPPGESCRFTPKTVTQVWVRSQSGVAKIITTLIPG